MHEELEVLPAEAVGYCARCDGRGKQWRVLQLQKVFGQFDRDGSGFIEAAELLALGQARRELGQKQQAWTPQRNSNLMRTMCNGEQVDKVPMEQFVRHFEAEMPHDREAFLRQIDQFERVSAAAYECTEQV